MTDEKKQKKEDADFAARTSQIRQDCEDKKLTRLKDKLRELKYSRKRTFLINKAVKIKRLEDEISREEDRLVKLALEDIKKKHIGYFALSYLDLAAAKKLEAIYIEQQAKLKEGESSEEIERALAELSVLKGELEKKEEADIELEKVYNDLTNKIAIAQGISTKDETL